MRYFSMGKAKNYFFTIILVFGIALWIASKIETGSLILDLTELLWSIIALIIGLPIYIFGLFLLGLIVFLLLTIGDKVLENFLKTFIKNKNS